MPTLSPTIRNVLKLAGGAAAYLAGAALAPWSAVLFALATVLQLLTVQGVKSADIMRALQKLGGNLALASVGLVAAKNPDAAHALGALGAMLIGSTVDKFGTAADNIARASTPPAPAPKVG